MSPLLTPATEATMELSVSPSELFDVEFFERLNINMNSEITIAHAKAMSTSNHEKAEWKQYDLYDMW